jgi:predicted transglutaminase-like cysteine proteinase
MRLLVAAWFSFIVMPTSIAAQPSRYLNVSDALIDEQAQRYGDLARERLVSWRRILTDPAYRDLTEIVKLGVVNSFINQTPFVDDRTQWDVEDYWATPVEFLSANGGDCEDFAIAKYMTLRALGISQERLKLTYAMKPSSGESHGARLSGNARCRWSGP